MRFSKNFLDDLRERIPISEVIGPHVTWDRKKTNTSRGDFWACCPFHGEKTPSFHCENKKGYYHCFSCNESGDHFKFLTAYEGVNFVEAVTQLAHQAGVALPQSDPGAIQREQKRASLEDVMDMATGFFEQQLQEASGARARAYLRDRGLSGRTLATFRLGFAPDNRNAVKEYLSNQGVEKELIEACGLVVHGPDIAVSYDRFRNRIMFPIPSSRGRIIAFGGRAMNPDTPAKYLNSNETELFHKSNVLFNYARAQKTIKKDETSLIVVEGYMDVIALHQAGIENAVAPLGTALTENQLRLLWRVSAQPVLCFDGDKAGQSAAHRGIDLALPRLLPGKSVKFALLPDGKDPDDLVNEEGRSVFDNVIKNARGLVDMLWSREVDHRVYDTPESKAELEKRLGQIISVISDDSVKHHYRQDIRNRLRLFFSNKTYHGQGNAYGGKGLMTGGGFQKGRYSSNERNNSMIASDKLKRSNLVSRLSELPTLRESVLVYTIISHPHMLIDDCDILMELELGNKELQNLWQVMQQACANGAYLTRKEMADYLAKNEMTAIVERLERQMRQLRLWQTMADAAPEDARKGFMQAFSLHQRTRALKWQKNELERDIALVTEQGDELSVPELMIALQQIQVEITRLESQEAIIDGFGLLSGRNQSQ